jgi:hypothetical protein
MTQDDASTTVRRYSLFQIERVSSPGFDPSDYSLFKFGDGSRAIRFGRELAKGFISRHSKLVLQPAPPVVCPSPYHCLPTASTHLANAFITAVNDHRADAGLSAVIQSRIHRNQTYVEDYGAMSAAERMALITQDTYVINQNLLAGQSVFFVDDIRVTGGHEKTIRRILSSADVECDATYVYYASVTASDIQPQYENELNYASVNSLADMAALAARPDFGITTRFVKRALSAPQDAFQRFWPALPHRVRDAFIRGAVGNNYHLIEQYVANVVWARHVAP